MCVEVWKECATARLVTAGHRRLGQRKPATPCVSRLGQTQSLSIGEGDRLRDSAEQNWDLFKPYLAKGSDGGKAKQTEWLVKLNDIRKCVMHPAAGVVLGFDDLGLLEEDDAWLQQSIPDAGAAI